MIDIDIDIDIDIVLAHWEAYDVTHDWDPQLDICMTDLVRLDSKYIPLARLISTLYRLLSIPSLTSIVVPIDVLGQGMIILSPITIR